MINLAPFYYRKLLSTNSIIEFPEYFEIEMLNGKKQVEAVVSLKNNLKPIWVKDSLIYRNSDGAGTADYKNIAVYKAISEALERLAFYELVDCNKKNYAFDINPTTTGMAAFPSLTYSEARKNAKMEAVERWAIHEINRGNLPIIKHNVKNCNLSHLEILTPVKDIKVTLLVFKHDDFYAYGFAGGNDLNHSFNKALVELDRNIRVLKIIYNKKPIVQSFENATDRTIFYFSTNDGYEKFEEIINNAPLNIKNTNPKIICDKSVDGRWNEYTKVWRYLLEDSYFPCHEDHTFFMF